MGIPSTGDIHLLLLIKVNHSVRGVTGLVRSPEWSREYGRHENPQIHDGGKRDTGRLRCAALPRAKDKKVILPGGKY